MNRLLLLIVLAISFSLEADEKPFIQMTARQSGLFSMFNSLLYFLADYENGSISGLEVDFKDKGPYYEAEFGPNWWHYYCEPIFIGNKCGMQIRYKALGFPREFSRQEAHILAQKYIRVLPHIQQKVEQFIQANFEKYFVIGLHYRGTDKIIHAPRVAYEEAISRVQALVESLRQDYKIFVATDEQAFIETIQQAFPGRVIFQMEAIRSTNGKPIHLKQKANGYKLGEDALTDCLLLSRSDYLIRTNSNLSLWSTYFNPDVPVVELNQRYKKGEKR